MDMMTLVEVGAALGASLAAAGAGAAIARGLWRWASGEDGKMRHNEHIQHISLAAQVEIARAAQPLPPQTYSPHTAITYSPHFTGRAIAGEQAAPAGLGTQQPALVAVPTFAELLQTGRIGRGQQTLLLGWEDGQGLWGNWEDLYSSAIGGLSGSGKSWAACNLLAQSVLNGGRLLLVDPDASNSESLSARLAPLSSRFVCDPAEDDRDIQTTIALAAREIERRRATKEQHSPLVVAIDEYAALMNTSLGPALSALVEDIARRGRRLGVYAMCLSQVWQASRSGGAHTRDAFASAYLMRMRSKQASMLSGLPARDLPADILELPSGQGYLLTTKGELRRIAQPVTTPDDMKRVAALLPDNLHSQAETLVGGGYRSGGGVEAGAVAAPPASCKALTAQEVQILTLVREGNSMTAIIEAVWGSRGGNKYRERASEVMRVIAENLQPSQA